MKFCIMCAGKGTRNNYFNGLHKALLPLGNKATISRILEKVDKDVEIVLAVGYKAEQIKSYMDLVHADRKITYVYVDNYDQKGSGPGYSLLCCKEHLQEPFILTSVDTIIMDNICFSAVVGNWIGVAGVHANKSEQYCLVDSHDGMFKAFYFGIGTKVYTGMAGISDYKEFWLNLETNKIIRGEFQVIHGFEGLKEIALLDVKWHDTGNNEAYEETRKLFKDVVANKNNETIFIDGGYVIKFFSDKDKASKRVDRIKDLKGICPDVKVLNENMYCYEYVKGKMLSEVFDDEVFRSFLTFCKKNLFFDILLNIDEHKKFIEDCKEMYENKTKSRLVKMFGTELDNIEIINGVKVPSIETIINNIQWDVIYQTLIPSKYHGDLQPENIIFDGKDFTLIDWRECFGQSINVGDTYYDLSKIYHALLINGTSVLNKQYDYKIEGNEAQVIFHIKNNLVSYMRIFEDFCKDSGYDWKLVEILGALHFINICTLYDNFHEGKFGKFLFLLGKYLITKGMNK